MPAQQADERTRLLRHNSPINSRNERASNGRPNGNTNRNSDDDDEDDAELVQFEEGDNENPRNWSLFWKYIQVFLVFIVGLILPMASSIWSPGISEIASDYNTNNQLVTGSQTGFVCMLGIGPLFFAPMSETFGRRIVFLVNLTLFTLFQIPTALAPNIETFVVMRTLGGLFGSVGVANGGGSISDMFETHERATVLGFYLLGPLLGMMLSCLALTLLLTFIRSDAWSVPGWNNTGTIPLALGVWLHLCHFCGRHIHVLLLAARDLRSHHPGAEEEEVAE